MPRTTYAVCDFPTTLHRRCVVQENMTLAAAEKLARKLLQSCGFIVIVNSAGVVWRRLEARWWSRR